MADRELWGKSHPWLAGAWFGALLGLLAGVLIAIASGVVLGVVVGALSGIVTGLAFGYLIQRSDKWLERPDASSVASPTRGRPWIKLSDRVLTIGLVVAVVFDLFSLLDLINGVSVGDVLAFAFYSWLAVTIWIERRRRSQAP